MPYNIIQSFYIFRIKLAKNATVGKTPKKGKAKGKPSKDGKSIGKFYSAYPAVVAEWVDKLLQNLQRQESCSDPGSNPAQTQD